MKRLFIALLLLSLPVAAQTISVNLACDAYETTTGVVTDITSTVITQSVQSRTAYGTAVVKVPSSYFLTLYVNGVQTTYKRIDGKTITFAYQIDMPGQLQVYVVRSGRKSSTVSVPIIKGVDTFGCVS